MINVVISRGFYVVILSGLAALFGVVAYIILFLTGWLSIWRSLLSVAVIAVGWLGLVYYEVNYATGDDPHTDCTDGDSDCE